jgi:CRP/FNR family transcriptional regulator, cyclic AMP receptor protein
MISNAAVTQVGPLFAGVNKNMLKEMMGVLVRETWPPDCDIQGTPTPVPRFRIIVRGRVKITRSNSDNGREVTLWLLGPGDAFDIIDLLDDEAHPIAAWTLDEVETLAAPVSVVREWLDRSAQLRVAMNRYIARQLYALTELTTDIALHDTLTRLAHLLLRHFSDGDEARAPKPNLIQDLPQEEIASLIGSVRVVVSRLLAQLKKQSIVELRHGAIRVLDLKRLLRIAQSHVNRRAPGARERTVT